MLLSFARPLAAVDIKQLIHLLRDTLTDLFRSPIQIQAVRCIELTELSGGEAYH